MNDQLQNYIKQMHERGFSDKKVRKELKRAGWSDEDVNKELGGAEPEEEQKSVAKPSVQGPFTALVVVLALLFSFGTLGAYFYMQEEEPGVTEVGGVSDKQNKVEEESNESSSTKEEAAPAAETELKVLHPNGGEEFCLGEPIRIRWTVSEDIETVYLYWRRGVSETLITSRPARMSQYDRLGYSQYMWRPNAAGGEGYVRVYARPQDSDGYVTSFQDYSDNSFRIVDCSAQEPTEIPVEEGSGASTANTLP